MKQRTLVQVGDLMGAQLLEGEDRTPVCGASIDSRTVEAGQLFFALPGSNTHGVHFARQAMSRGASAVVVSPQQADQVSGPRLSVEQPAEALAQLAARVREEEQWQLPAAAVTGSVGKTTTCGFVAQLLTTLAPTQYPKGSYNNYLGVPLTILNAAPPCRYLICEVGSNAPGEVLTLARWVFPRVACVTAIGPAHLKGFGSLGAIENEKLSILDAIEDGDEGWIPVEFAERCRGRKWVFTFGPGGDLEVRQRADREWTLKLAREGRELPFAWRPPLPHSKSNLEAALAVGIALGAPPEGLLAQVDRLVLPPLRGEVQEHGGVDLLLDCYNSNPASLESAITRLETEPASGRKVCVVGSMEELGQDEEQWHRRLGGRLAALDQVYLVGRCREWVRAGLREMGSDGELLSVDDLSAQRLADSLRPGDRVLFKASRREALEGLAHRVAQLLNQKSEAR